MTDIKLPRIIDVDQLRAFAEQSPDRVKVLSICPDVSTQSGPLTTVASLEELRDLVSASPEILFALASTPQSVAKDWVESTGDTFSNLVALGASPVEWLQSQVPGAIQEMTAIEVYRSKPNADYIDVRGADEYHGPLSHIEGARLVTLGPDLEHELLASCDRERPVIFICRSGARSMRAALLAREFGFTHPINLKGGMIAWNEAGLPVAKAKS